MKNDINIQPTKFEDIPTGEITLGVRIYDSYDNMYQNTWHTIPSDDMDILRWVIEKADDQVKDLLSFIEETESGLYIGNKYYEWSQIKHCFD